MSFFPEPPPSWAVLRNKAGEALLDMLLFYGETLFSGGRSLLRDGDAFHSGNAHDCALYRLRKQGIAVMNRHGHEVITVDISPESRLMRRYLEHPEIYWDRTWDGIWYVIMYDVPEKERALRNSFRHICRNWKMGLLQKSVWLTPHDIRAPFRDLQEVSLLPQYSFLMAMRTVLGLSSRELVLTAWNMIALEDYQHRYLKEVASASRYLLAMEDASREELSNLLMQEMLHYSTIMCHDPLLPRTLWLEGYPGPRVVAAHRDFVKHAKKRLKAMA
jgi:phenylacetic acid degradation operon negative regulatory protein